MRKLFIILTLAIAMISGTVVAEAVSRCTCTSHLGTTQFACQEHRGCFGIQQHQHDGRYLRRNIPVLCETNDFYLLIDPNGPTCREVKRQLKKEARLQKRSEREIARAYKQAAREERLARRNNPLYWVVDIAEKEFKREVRREVRDKRNRVKRNIRREIRDIF